MLIFLAVYLIYFGGWLAKSTCPEDTAAHPSPHSGDWQQRSEAKGSQNTGEPLPLSGCPAEGLLWFFFSFSFIAKALSSETVFPLFEAYFLSFLLFFWRKLLSLFRNYLQGTLFLGHGAAFSVAVWCRSAACSYSWSSFSHHPLQMVRNNSRVCWSAIYARPSRA